MRNSCVGTSICEKWKTYIEIALLGTVYKIVSKTTDLKVKQKAEKDFKQAYDTINWKKLYKVLQQLRLPAKLINSTKMTLEHTTNKVKSNGKISKSFQTDLGLKQVDPLSTTLWILCCSGW